MKAAQTNKNKTIRRIFMANMLEVKHINKTYKGQVSYQALKQISFSIEEGGFTAVMGPSGSGKTTLLNIISTIDRPDSGDILIHGENPHRLKRTKLAHFRRKQLGFVFQDFNLLDTLTIGENIMLPLTLEKKRRLSWKKNCTASRQSSESKTCSTNGRLKYPADSASGRHRKSGHS